MAAITYILLLLGVCGLFQSSFAEDENNFCGNDVSGLEVGTEIHSKPIPLEPGHRVIRLQIPHGDRVCKPFTTYVGVKVVACDSDDAPIVKFETGTNRFVLVMRTGSTSNFGSVKTIYYCQ